MPLPKISPPTLGHSGHCPDYSFYYFLFTIIFLLFYLEWTRHVCWPRLTYKRVEPVVSISWASCLFICSYGRFLRFYRATLCVSAVFAVARCLSLCPSVTLLDCIQTAEDIVKLLVRLVAHHSSILFPSADTQFQGNPFSGGPKYKEVGKICDFRLKSPFISVTVRDRSMVAMVR